MKFGIQSRENTLILNILFGIDDLVPNFGPTMEVLSDFVKFDWMTACGNFTFNWVLTVKNLTLSFTQSVN